MSSTTYAILGATGNTGLCLLQILLENPNNRINAYCRSKSKLLKQLPQIPDNKNVNIFEGSLNDTDLLANCLRGTRAAFLAVAVTNNVPGTTIARDTAAAVIPALEKLQSESNASSSSSSSSLPRRLVVLSASPLEPKFTTHTPPFILGMLTRACSNIYHDLAEAEKLLRAHESLIKTVFVKPGALVQGPRQGYKLSTEEMESPISFMDLAAGMVEIGADEVDEERFDMRNVSVNAVAKDIPFGAGKVVELLKGLIYHFLPWTYGWI